MKVAAKSRCRSRGAAVAVLVFVIGFFIVGMIGLFSFEVTRNNTARQELQAASQAASLAAAAALASNNSTDPTTAHNNAYQAALNTLTANSIVGVSLGTAGDVTTQQNTAGSGGAAAAARVFDPPSNGCNMFIEFLDTSGNPKPYSDATGQIAHVICAFGEQPAFGAYVGINKATVYAESKAQVPQMDIVMCFDVSGSIDDQSSVSYIERYWTTSAGRITDYPGDTSTAPGPHIFYHISKTANGVNAQGSIWGCEAPTPSTGSGPGYDVQIEQPQDLGFSQLGGSSSAFDPSTRSATGTDAGTPPGNYPGGGSPGGDPKFTDLVTNFTMLQSYMTTPTDPTVAPPYAGGTTFPPFPFTWTDPKTGQSWYFPDVATIVEASRGNLDDASSGGKFYTSQANTSVLNSTVVGQLGKPWRQAYMDAAHYYAQPIGAARAAATNFFSIMNNNTQAWFGFISFGSGAFTTNTAALTWPAVSRAPSSYGPNVTVTDPGVSPLSASNFSTIVNSAIPMTQADGATDMGDALNDAIQMLQASPRTNSRKAIIFFTDGQPSSSYPNWSSYVANAKNSQIQIFTVGLAQNSPIIPGEVDNLNDGKPVTYTDPQTGSTSTYTPTQQGMAQLGFPGGKFFLVTNPKDLNYVFENIARQLVQISQ